MANNSMKKQNRAKQAARKAAVNQRRRAHEAENPRNQLRGLNVTRIPKAPNLKKAVVPVHDSVTNWSDLLADPFSAPSEGVYPPISNDMVPCPSTKVRNYGTTSLNLAGSDTQVAMWFYPTGSITIDGLQGFSLNNTNPTQNNCFGPILDAGLTQDFASAGVYVAAPIGVAFQTAPPIATTVTPMPWDSLSNPFLIPDKPSDVKFKCTAFAVRVTYDGKLSDTEGYVDYYNPYAWTGTVGVVRSMESLRRDPSHRRAYFANKRTHTFVWHPNCESSTYSTIDKVAPFASNDKVSRFMLRIGGVAAGDKIEVEYIGFQEFTGHPAVATNTPSPITKDLVHVANAIPELKGQMNSGASGGKKTTLAQHVAAQKVISHPEVFPQHKNQNHGSVLSQIAKGASTAASIAEDVLPLLSLL
jgi:hypothetical protein